MNGIGSTIQKATVVPIAFGSWDFQVEQPVPILPKEDVFIEDTRGLLSTSDFDLWQKYIPEKEIKNLSSFRLALVQRFLSPVHTGNKEEQKSKELLHHIFVCLRVVRPTRAQFQAIQFKILDDRKIDIFSVTQPRNIPIVIPQSDALNSIRSSDIATLCAVVESFLDLLRNGPANIRRAVRYYNTGYQDVPDPIVQVMLWTAGIEAVVSSGAEIRRPQVVEKVYELIGADWNIYEDSAVKEFTHANVKVAEVVRDLFHLRSRLVHGGWIPDEWLDRKGRPGMPDNVSYPDLLREAASAVLRKLLMGWLLSHRIPN